MGREVRRVTKDWKHPKDSSGRYEPLYDGVYFRRNIKEAEKMVQKKGLRHTIEYFGNTIRESCAMLPDATEDQLTHIMMYENTSEGTPISPAFDTPEGLARWLADNGASSFGSMTATYEQWLGICRGGWAPSAVVIGGKMKSGVEAMHEMESQ